MRCSHNWLALPWQSVNLCQKRPSHYQHSTWSQFTEQTTRVAFVEATKYEANPATDEVRVENRNHGLAWPQKGNNGTVARLLSLFKVMTKERTTRSCRKTHILSVIYRRDPMRYCPCARLVILRKRSPSRSMVGFQRVFPLSVFAIR